MQTVIFNSRLRQVSTQLTSTSTTRKYEGDAAGQKYALAVRLFQIEVLYLRPGSQHEINISENARSRTREAYGVLHNLKGNPEDYLQILQSVELEVKALLVSCGIYLHVLVGSAIDPALSRL